MGREGSMRGGEQWVEKPKGPARGRGWRRESAKREKKCKDAARKERKEGDGRLRLLKRNRTFSASCSDWKRKWRK